MQLKLAEFDGASSSLPSSKSPARPMRPEGRRLSLPRAA
jgi:hypothetical protein